jgi:hypothetical protein
MWLCSACPSGARRQQISYPDDHAETEQFQPQFTAGSAQDIHISFWISDNHTAVLLHLTDVASMAHPKSHEQQILPIAIIIHAG